MSDITPIARPIWDDSAATETKLPPPSAPVKRKAPSESISRAMPSASRVDVPSSSRSAVKAARPGRAAGSAALPHRETSDATVIGRWCDSTR
jgi:hypothetical protein